MQQKLSNGDGVRLSVSSVHSSSSQGSGSDDIEALGDVYVWGEVWSDGILLDGFPKSSSSKTHDALVPRALESDVVLDVQQIVCGARHAALVTRQGEVFTWGDESGGQLGHGSGKDVCRPRLVESLVFWNMDYVACGEYHTCAISADGDLFAWGDGHGTDVSHWIPRRVCGPLEGLGVLSVACGTWHSALATWNGKVFTFGDGTFGVLGHGDRESVGFPREVESLNGSRAVKVACGVWHTAAIIEVMGPQTGAGAVPRKLFTWGDGDKYRLGHGDNEARLVPACVPSLVDYNFDQLACGHDITIALTTSGHVFTMGSASHGQLGSPRSDGKVPCLVQERLVGEVVEEIGCGAHHVAVLTSRREVYTWGRGSNGRLGHGDTEDRKTPTLVEALKERRVRSISCGSNFTACICNNKWVSSTDQSLCSGCRQAFGFTRKRHNCYNCGLGHCHACSSKKALKAALAPTPEKPHRVCDSCYSKIKAAQFGNTSMVSKRNVKEKSNQGEKRSSKNETRLESMSLMKAPQVSSLLQLKDFYFTSSLCALQTSLKAIKTPAPPPPPPPRVSSNPSLSINLSSRQFTSPASSKGVIDHNLTNTNELLNQEVRRLRYEVKTLKKRCEGQHVVLENLENSEKRIKQESAKYSAAVEVIRSIDSQLKDIAEKGPPEFSRYLNACCTQVEAFLKHNEGAPDVSSSTVDSSSSDQLHLTNEGADTHKQSAESARNELELSQ